MRKRTTLTLEIRPARRGRTHGWVKLPREVLDRYGLHTGAKIRLQQDEQRLALSHSTASLARVYLEPTNTCNLDCRICVRNAWEETPGSMSAATFQAVLQGVAAFTPTPSIFLGGFGEPLAHPLILDMIAAAKKSGAVVEMITNATLLSQEIATMLVELKLDRLWVSLDGATPESYADVRLGAALPQVLENLQRLETIRRLAYAAQPRLGICFVAMRRNIHDLPAVVRMGRRLGADQFLVTNVLPHTPEMRQEMLFERSLYDGELPASEWAPRLCLPRLDLNDLTLGPLAEVLKGRGPVSIARQELALGANTCPFVECGSLSIRWDGAVAPCLALLHSHFSYLEDRKREISAFAVGNIHDRALVEIWNDPHYTALREQLLDFDFSPCVFCNSCEMADSNQEDCFGNILPACGGCLWAQGLVQCP